MAEVTFASFGYYSLTARPQDVTPQLREMLRNGKLRFSTFTAASLRDEQWFFFKKKYEQLLSRCLWFPLKLWDLPVSWYCMVPFADLQRLMLTHADFELMLWITLPAPCGPRPSKCRPLQSFWNGRRGRWFATSGHHEHSPTDRPVSKQQGDAARRSVATHFCRVAKASKQWLDWGSTRKWWGATLVCIQYTVVFLGIFSVAMCCNHSPGMYMIWIHMMESVQGLRLFSHPENEWPRYTWYKLNEWMQVEILQIFGQSLENEPWYRFPYFQFLKVYFDVLFQESIIVQSKLGLKKAFGSMAFVTSFVPGLIMTLLFAQMKLLATPMLAMPGFGETYDESRAREQLVVLRPKDAPKVDWKKLDERITDIRCAVQGLFIMKVPTFKVGDQKSGSDLSSGVMFPDITPADFLFKTRWGSHWYLQDPCRRREHDIAWDLRAEASASEGLWWSQRQQGTLQPRRLWSCGMFFVSNRRCARASVHTMRFVRGCALLTFNDQSMPSARHLNWTGLRFLLLITTWRPSGEWHRTTTVFTSKLRTAPCQVDGFLYSLQQFEDQKKKRNYV